MWKFLQESQDETVFGRLRLRAEVQMAPITLLRPRQRLQGHIYGLVPVSFMLCLSV